MPVAVRAKQLTRRQLLARSASTFALAGLVVSQNPISAVLPIVRPSSADCSRAMYLAAPR